MMKQTIRKILLAEDNNEHYINFIQAINKISKSIEIFRVVNGYELLSLLETNVNPDLIFLDIDMPYKGGLQILEEIQEKNKILKIPVIILSGSSFELAVKLAFKLGALLFIKKYNRSVDLQKSLESLFNNPHFIARQQAPWEEFVIA